jgi:1-pyrroline-5-carboxylate dehydrogenase
MSATKSLDKITYTSSTEDLDAFHDRFDDALRQVRSEQGRVHPMYIGGESVISDLPPIVDVTPADTQVELGRFQSAAVPHVDRAVVGAKAAGRGWETMGWQERARILREAARITRQRKYELGALAALEVGKSRLEAMGEVEESADLIDYYCKQMEDAGGFVRTMNRITPHETNVDVLRPYGVFACIAPFNFPMALSFGMSSAALVAGNTVVFKPAEQTPWTGLKVYEIYRDAGVPPGVFQCLTGAGKVIGDALWGHPGVDGVVFTGSKEVGMRIFKGLSTSWVKPCLLELGGKNPAIVMDTADIDAAAEGVLRSAWGLQNQKCSATSRVYVHRAVSAPFIDALLAKTAAMRSGDPTERDVFFGPVIARSSVARFEEAVAEARRTGEILTGGGRMKGSAFDRGHFLEPTVARLPLSSPLFRTELFVPFLALGEVESLEQALEESNDVEYGLTAGIFSRRAEEIQEFFQRIEAGVAYANKRSGATTGAWPGAQPFCGWKASGGSGKGGCGPYYVQQFMREQCQTTIAES